MGLAKLDILCFLEEKIFLLPGQTLKMFGTTGSDAFPFIYGDFEKKIHSCLPDLYTQLTRRRGYGSKIRIQSLNVIGPNGNPRNAISPNFNCLNVISPNLNCPNAISPNAISPNVTGINAEMLE